ncbi:MAG: NADH-quinone oxidoreductase subunit M [Rubritalea sp.]|jgi:NADH-quinone oxidoreductase subunit M|tara:strand:+ start:80114 stop:81529 length:1416 start_codon:yes stop_codon:yes gene_type:complete
MLTLALILIPLLAVAAIFFGDAANARKIALIAAAANIAVAIAALSAGCSGFNLNVLSDPNINLALSVDSGISMVMLLLSVIVTLAAVLSGSCPEGREKLWFTSTLLISAGAIGAFISTDLFFFFAFHELALIPTFLMIGILGRGDRKEVAWKTTIYLAFGSIVLLAGLLMIADQLGSFDMTQLKPVESHQNEIALLLIIGFGTLVSLFPFHSWAAPAYASAPAPVSMLHAGVLKKFGLYGLIVVGYEVVPDGMAHWLPLLLVLLLCNIIWVGLVTINQKRLDLMLGNSSVMHMGYIFLAIAALVDNGSSFATQAAVLLMFAHGISIAMSFCLADRIEAKTGTLEINQLGGLAKNAPSLAFLFGLVGMASIGLPGLANFAGEIMVFFSGFEGWEPADGLGPLQITTIIAIWGVVISAVYMLRAFRNIFQGETVNRTEKVNCLSRDEKIPAILLGLILLIVGIYPQAILQFLN